MRIKEIAIDANVPAPTVNTLFNRWVKKGLARKRLVEGQNKIMEVTID